MQRRTFKVNGNTDGPLIPEPLLTPAEVAVLFKVNPRTVTRWVRQGRIPDEGWFFTIGGHRRFRLSAIESLRSSARRSVTP
jgi:excisionase family DNA binding protein